MICLFCIVDFENQGFIGTIFHRWPLPEKWELPHSFRGEGCSTLPPPPHASFASVKEPLSIRLLEILLKCVINLCKLKTYYVVIFLMTEVYKNKQTITKQPSIAALILVRIKQLPSVETWFRWQINLRMPLGNFSHSSWQGL